jgi:hypothetical protein
MAILPDAQRDSCIPPQRTPSLHLAPMQSLELRIRWLEALLYGSRHDDSLAGLREPKPELKHGETLIRAAEHAHRRMNDIASTYDVLRKFISHCKTFSYHLPCCQIQQITTQTRRTACAILDSYLRPLWHAPNHCPPGIRPHAPRRVGRTSNRART